MSITAADIIKYNCDTKWFEHGLDYALISWASTFNRMGSANPYSRIEKIIIGLIAEDCFEQYLKDNKIAYNLAGRTKWYQKDVYDIGIKNYAVDVKSNFIDENLQYIKNIYPKSSSGQRPSWFLDCTALIPMDQFAVSGENEKIYVFPFVSGYFAEELSSEYIVHAFWDYNWLKKDNHKNDPNLGCLNIRYKGTIKGQKIRIYGTTAPKEAVVEEVVLDNKLVRTKNSFYQVFSIQWIGEEPDGTLKIVPLNCKISEVIEPNFNFSIITSNNNKQLQDNNWQSLKFYNGEIFLTAWDKKDDISIKGSVYKRFSKNIKQYQDTKIDNMGVEVQDLSELSLLKQL